MAGRSKISRATTPTQKPPNSSAQQAEQKLPSLIPSSDDDALAILRASISPVSFWQPEYVPPHSAWLEHAPFAFWLIETLRPRFLVELGTHSGLSYFAFCQAVQRLQMETRCYAVDTWKGDEHAGFYGEEVFRKVQNQNDKQYSAFSTLIRSSFDEASRHFSNQSIDLLHIDGRHFYDDVKHDFETWQPKLSNRAVVIFHDTNVRERDFGVFALWSELCQERPHFEFFHGHGLGILGIGNDLPDRILALFAARANVEASTQIRRAYSRLGSAVTFEVRSEQAQLAAEGHAAGLNNVLAALSERNSECGALQHALAERDAKIAALEQALSERDSERGVLRSRVADVETSLAAASAESARLDAELEYARTRAAHLGSELETRDLELRSIRASTSWRLSRPIRRVGNASPRFAQLCRRALNSLSGASIFSPGQRTKPSTHVQGGTARNQQDQSCLLQDNQLNSLAVRRQSVPENRKADGRLLEESGLLDADAYRAVAGIDAATNAAEHYLAVGWRQKIEPGPDFEGHFLDLYFRSAGFDGPPAMTYIRLRATGWPVYATRAQAEPVAALIRASNLFDAAGYAARHGSIGELDPALHYVIVGELMGLTPSDGFDPEYYGDRYPDVVQVRSGRLAHYLTSGRAEGRRPVPKAKTLSFDHSRIDPKRETVLLITHQASRTGAPILAYNVAMRLRQKYNVVAVLLAGGELVEDFHACCAAVVGPLAPADLADAAGAPGEAKHLVKHILATYRVAYAIVNSISSWIIVPPLARAFVPVVLLVHEFASYTRPKSAMRQGLDWATEIVFSADLIARSAHEEHPSLKCRPIHILPQGRCDLPPAPRTSASPGEPWDLRQVFRPPAAEDALIVLGCGFVHIRKGVDLFLSCAAAVAALRPKRAVRFVWIGEGYDPETDTSYSCYLADQIARSGLKETVAIIDAIADLEPAYAMADFFFLSSRLDPLPNVTIDAALRGIPVICFEGASGMAELIGADTATKQCVVPHLDAHAAARVIAELVSDDAKRRQVGDAFRRIGKANFNMNRYVSSLDALGNNAVKTMRQRAEDFATLRDDPLFDANFFSPFDAAPVTRSGAIINFLARWTVVGTSPGGGSDYFFRRPCAGFHPQIYAHEHAEVCDTTVVNPLAHFIRSGKPGGPWSHDVIIPASPVREPVSGDSPSCAIHAHFHYPELAEDFLCKIAANGSRCDLLLSTDGGAKARILRKATSQYGRGEVMIRVVPNRGRDIGTFLSAFDEDIVKRYDIVGHVHGKRSLHATNSSDPYFGERWREFLWQNLLGDLHPMMDIVIARLTADDKLGIVFAHDPHLLDWDSNQEIAEGLAARMGMKEPLPPFFDFPVGTMFWARTAALKPLFNLKLGWSDYPEEPLPNDGTILHALERLLPFVAQHAGYRLAVTHVPGMTW
jgi:glycosyltransferase involved in cell wall biosynthesis